MAEISPHQRLDQMITGYWISQAIYVDFDPEDKEAFEKNKPIAEKKLKDQERFKLDNYIWTGGGFRRPLKVGELVLQLVKDAPGRVILYPPGRVILIRPYRGKKEDRKLVFLRIPKVRRRQLRDVKQRLGDTGKLLRALKNPRLIKGRRAVHGLLQLWPSLDDFE
jgi:hypothetical protein